MVQTPKNKTMKVTLYILVALLAIVFLASRAKRLYNRESNKPAHSAITISEKNIIETEHEQESKMANLTSPLPKNLLLGQPKPALRDSLLVSVPPGLSNRDGLLMHREAFNAFQEMHQAAKNDGVQLLIISAWRSFNHQKRIWENKWNGRQTLSGNINATNIADPAERAREILRFSAMPGTSRHHWGTDIDINNLNNSYFSNGKGKKEYDWLKANAHLYGFCQPYTPLHERNNKGYEEEKWHWSYMPVASVYLKAYQNTVLIEDLTGFDGSETVQSLDVIDHYVLNIAKECISFNEPEQ